MKSALIITLGLTLLSCGKDTVKKTKYVENPYDNSANDVRFNNVEARLTALESAVAANIAATSGLSSSLSAQAASLSALQLELEQADADTAALLQTAITAGTAAYNSITSSIASMQSQINGQVTQIAVLEGQDNVVEYLDPCGNGAGYDEVLLKTSSGKVLAYFEQGNNRHLTILDVGVLYQTTDGQACQFKVDSAGALVY